MNEIDKAILDLDVSHHKAALAAAGARIRGAIPGTSPQMRHALLVQEIRATAMAEMCLWAMAIAEQERMRGLARSAA